MITIACFTVVQMVKEIKNKFRDDKNMPRRLIFIWSFENAYNEIYGPVKKENKKKKEKKEEKLY